MINSEAKFFASKAKEREKMINRIYKGVPDSVRGRLWYILLDIDRAKREKKGIYEQMKKLARNSSPDIRQIDLVGILLYINAYYIFLSRHFNRMLTGLIGTTLCSGYVTMDARRHCSMFLLLTQCTTQKLAIVKACPK